MPVTTSTAETAETAEKKKPAKGNPEFAAWNIFRACRDSSL
jgi:hypothetical protein